VIGARLPRLVFLALLAAWAVQAWVYYPQLPLHLASHFDGAGHPNGFSSKAAFFGLEALILVLIAGSFGVLPAQLHRFSNQLINLPHKDYWLAPQRREATLGAVADAMTWFGCAAVLLLLVVTQLVIRFNLERSPTLPSAPMWALLAGFGLCTVLLMARLLRFARRPRD